MFRFARLLSLLCLALSIVALALALVACGGSPAASKRHHAPRSATIGTQHRLPDGQYECLTAHGWVPHACGFGKPVGPVLPGAPRPAGAGTGEQFDTVTIDTVPTGAHWLAGYVAGFWPSWFGLVRLPWHPAVKSIAVFFSNRAECGDFEPGDMTPGQVVAWFYADRAAGFPRPCVYASEWEMFHQVLFALSVAGIPRSAYWVWDANYTYRAHIDPGADCTQWSDHAFGRNLDESTCTLAFLGVHPGPPPPPPDPYHYNALTALELRWTLRYDGARKHHKYDTYRTSVLQPEMGRLAHAVWAAAHTAPPRPVSWGYRHRGVRFQALYRRQLGQQIVK